MTKRIIAISAVIAIIAAGSTYAIQANQAAPASASALQLQPSGLTNLSGQPQYFLPGTVRLGQ